MSTRLHDGNDDNGNSSSDSDDKEYENNNDNDDDNDMCGGEHQQHGLSPSSANNSIDTLMTGEIASVVRVTQSRHTRKYIPVLQKSLSILLQSLRGYHVTIELKNDMEISGGPKLILTFFSTHHLMMLLLLLCCRLYRGG